MPGLAQGGNENVRRPRVVQGAEKIRVGLEIDAALFDGARPRLVPKLIANQAEHVLPAQWFFLRPNR